MDQNAIFIPVFAQIILTLAVFIILAKRKAQAVKEGADRSQAALNNKAWPEHVVKASNNIDNQFQIPVLFYVVCLAAFQMNNVDTIMLVLASIFSVSRYFHAYVHLGSNFVPKRLKIFLIGVLALLGMTIHSVIHILFS